MLSKFFDKYISQKNLYFSILSILVIIFLCKNMDISLMVFITIIFAATLNPLVDKLENKMKRSFAATIVLLLFLLIVSIFILPILAISVYEIVEFAKEFPQYITNIDAVIRKMPLLHTIGITHLNTESVTNAFTSSSVNIFKSILDFISQTGTALLYIFTSLVLLFFFLVDKKQIRDAIIKLFPSEYREKTGNLLDKVTEKLSGYVLAQTLVSGSVWVTMTIGLLIFKVEYAFALGIIAGILSIIPIIGSGLSLIICLMATFSMGWKYLLLVTILYTISHFIENHVVRPYVYSRFLDLHQVIIFIALIVGAKYHGVLGLILAPAFAMVLYVLLEDLYIKKMDEQLPEDIE